MAYHYFRNQCLIQQGWDQIRFIKYKYKYKNKYVFRSVKYKYDNKNLIKYKYKYSPSNTNKRWSRHKIDAILQMTYKNSFYYKKIVLFSQISLKLVSKRPINNKPALVKIMAWRWIGDKPLFEPMQACCSIQHVEFEWLTYFIMCPLSRKYLWPKGQTIFGMYYPNKAISERFG